MSSTGHLSSSRLSQEFSQTFGEILHPGNRAMESPFIYGFPGPKNTASMSRCHKVFIQMTFKSQDLSELDKKRMTWENDL